MRLFPARLGMAVAALAWGCTACEGMAAPITPADKTKPVSVADKLRRDLDQIVSLDIAEQPLNLAVNQIREQTKLNIVLDKVTLQAMGMDPDMVPITAKLKDVKLRSALRTIFGPYNLSFAIIGDTVLITTDEVAIYRQMHQRVSVDVESLDLATAIRQLARETATNLVIDPRVLKEAQAKVTLQVDDVPLDTAVRLMSEMAGLKPVKVGNTLFICSKATAKDLRDDETPGGPPSVPTVPVQPVPGMLPGGGLVVPGVGGLGGGGLVPVPAPNPSPPSPDMGKGESIEQPKPLVVDPKPGEKR